MRDRPSPIRRRFHACKRPPSSSSAPSAPPASAPSMAPMQLVAGRRSKQRGWAGSSARFPATDSAHSRARSPVRRQGCGRIATGTQEPRETRAADRRAHWSPDRMPSSSAAGRRQVGRHGDAAVTPADKRMQAGVYHQRRIGRRKIERQMGRRGAVLLQADQIRPSDARHAGRRIRIIATTACPRTQRWRNWRNACAGQACPDPAAAIRRHRACSSPADRARYRPPSAGGG